MASPVTNADLGLSRGHDSQSASKAARYAEAWEVIVTSAIRNGDDHWLTLAEYAALLDRYKVPTARGGPWTPAAVSRVLAANGVDAKSMHARVNKRIAGMRKTWPQEAYAQLRLAMEPLDALSEDNGTWKPVIEVRAAGLPVRVTFARFVTRDGQPFTLPDHEAVFQIWSEVALGRFKIGILSFIERKTVEMVVPGSEMETFVWNLSREERLARDDRVRARYLRDDNAIYKPV